MERTNFAKTGVSKRANYKKMLRVWLNMKARCFNKKDVSYKNYGARGITVCDRWMKFINFYDDMNQFYSEGKQLDRINNNGSYSPANCKWVTRKEQCSNRRSNRPVLYRGIIRTLTEWIDQLGLKRSTVYQRYYVYGWDIDKCLNYGRE